jgi:hypothetical protein
MTPTEIKFETSINAALWVAEANFPEAQTTIDSLRNLLLVKGREYRRNNDPYHNFNEGAKLMQARPMVVLNFFRLKHIISIEDLHKDLKENRQVSLLQVTEKFNDVLVYTLIELAYTENEGSASFAIYNDFVCHLVKKIKLIKKINGRV